MSYNAENEMPADIKEATQRHLRALFDATDNAIGAIGCAVMLLESNFDARSFKYAGELATRIVVGVVATRIARLRDAPASDYLPPPQNSAHKAELKRLTSYDAISRVPLEVASAGGNAQIHRALSAMHQLANIAYMGGGMAVWDRLSFEFLDNMVRLATTIIVAVAYTQNQQ